MDLRWGFHQCGISERMKQYFTFVTSFGTYTYNRLVMQATNAGTGDDASHDASGQTTDAEVVRMLRALSNECATQSLAWQEQQERTRSDQSEVGQTARPVQHTGTVARGRAMTKAGGDL